MKFLFCIFCLLAFELSAQTFSFLHPALVAQMGGGVAARHCSAVFLNAAGLRDTILSVITSASRPFAVPALNVISAAVYLPRRKSGFYVHCNRRGTDYYHRTLLGSGLVVHSAQVSWTAGLDLMQVHAEDLSTLHSLLGRAGVQFSFSDRWHAAAALLHCPMFSKHFAVEKMLVSAGIRWQALQHCTILADAIQMQDRPLSVALSFVYAYGKYLTVRLGWNAALPGVGGGCALRFGRIAIDYGIRYQPFPGLSQSCAATFFLHKP